jgi:hypothetical protein
VSGARRAGISAAPPPNAMRQPSQNAPPKPCNVFNKHRQK